MKPFSFQYAVPYLLWAWKPGNWSDLSARLLVLLLSQRPRCQWSRALLLQVIMKLRFLRTSWLANLRVRSLPASSEMPPFPFPCPWSSLHKGKEEWRAGNFLLRIWPRNETDHFHSHSIGYNLVHCCSRLQGRLGYVVSNRVAMYPGFNLGSSTANRKGKKGHKWTLSGFCHHASVRLCTVNVGGLSLCR